MLLINNDLTALVFLGSEFMVSKVSLEHATDRNSERSDHTGVRADWQLTNSLTAWVLTPSATLPARKG